MMHRRAAALLVVGGVIALMLIAWASPAPNRVTDREVYERTAESIIVPDCSDLQCFRVLVPWVIGRLPGESIVRWKVYAAVSNAAAALGVWLLCLTLGLSRRAAGMAAAMSAVGFGSLYTLHDPFTSDPLMYAIGPVMTYLLFNDRLALAAAIGVVGVLAKEFAAAPLYGWALFEALGRRWTGALQAVAAGNAVFITWGLLTIGLMLRFNYGWGWNGAGSANLIGGSALALWVEKQTTRGIASAMFNEFGALYLLAPVGFCLASATMRRLAIASMPVAVLFAYLQQPDRALWNFHYLVTPFAAIALDKVPAPMAWTTVALFAIGNLRVGAQLPIAPFSHIATLGSLILALVSCVAALRSVRFATRPTVPIVSTAAK